jgi:hypothetical protein
LFTYMLFKKNPSARKSSRFRKASCIWAIDNYIYLSLDFLLRVVTGANHNSLQQFWNWSQLLVSNMPLMCHPTLILKSKGTKFHLFGLRNYFGSQHQTGKSFYIFLSCQIGQLSSNSFCTTNSLLL